MAWNVFSGRTSEKLKKKDILEKQENYWNVVKLSLEIGVKAIFTERAQR